VPEGIVAALDKGNADPAVKAMVLIGAGRSFIAGADIRQFGKGPATPPTGRRHYNVMDESQKPVVAAIHGYALGGGSGVTACVDIPIAAKDAVFGFSEVKLGIIPAVISPFVLPRIGTAARRYFLTGERFGADIALRIGLVDELAEDLDAAVERVVAELLSSGPQAVREAKKLVREHPVGEDTAHLAARLRTSVEGQDGLRAFLERRKPNWIA
jgi:methylglutaconyl-CoA hydratase